MPFATIQLIIALNKSAYKIKKMIYRKLFSLVALSFLLACGQPGPLYLPTKSAPVPVKPNPDFKKPQQKK